MLRLGVSEKAITELVGIGEHVTGLCLGAAGHQLGEDQFTVGREELESDGEARDELHADVLRWASQHLDVDGLPRYWWLLRFQPRFRAANWRVHRLVLGGGEIDAKAKALIALGVASLRGSSFWVEYFTRYCRVAFDATDDELRETITAAMHSASYNMVSHGMRLKAERLDLRAADFHEGRAS